MGFEGRDVCTAMGGKVVSSWFLACCIGLQPHHPSQHHTAMQQCATPPAWVLELLEDAVMCCLMT